MILQCQLGLWGSIDFRLKDLLRGWRNDLEMRELGNSVLTEADGPLF